MEDAKRNDRGGIPATGARSAQAPPAAGRSMSRGTSKALRVATVTRPVASLAAMKPRWKRPGAVTSCGGVKEACAAAGRAADTRTAIRHVRLIALQRGGHVRRYANR